MVLVVFYEKIEDGSYGATTRCTWMNDIFRDGLLVDSYQFVVNGLVGKETVLSTDPFISTVKHSLHMKYSLESMLLGAGQCK